MSEHPVIACYRGLDSADAVGLGALLADAVGEPLVLACAYRYEPAALSARALPATDNERRATAAAAALRRARRFVRNGVEVREEVVPAVRIVDALTELARHTDACMLVVGRDVSGNITRSLIAHAPCPVAVAPLSVPLPRRGPLRRVGVAIDGSDPATCALAAAARLALATGAHLELLSAGQTAEHAAAWLHVARLSMESTGVSFSCSPLVGDPRSRLTEASPDLDLLVCGSRGHGRPLAALLGSVSAHDRRGHAAELPGSMSVISSLTRSAPSSSCRPPLRAVTAARSASRRLPQADRSWLRHPPASHATRPSTSSGPGLLFLPPLLMRWRSSRSP